MSRKKFKKFKKNLNCCYSDYLDCLTENINFIYGTLSHHFCIKIILADLDSVNTHIYRYLGTINAK